MSQSGILAPVPAAATFLALNLRAGADPRAALARLEGAHPDHRLVGIGPALVAALGREIPGLRPMPDWVGPGGAVPHTPSDLWIRVAGAEPGEVLHRVRALDLPDLEVVDRVDGFRHGGRDLTGYEDGTANPTGDEALAAAFLAGEGPGLDGGAVVAVQRWVHDLDAFERMSRRAQDDAIGRDRDTNEELDDAPASAHVKRTAQETFVPEAFVVRRSMAWSDARGAGLLFVSFSARLDPFEAQLRRMLGLEDGVADALYGFTRPVTGATYWCPPVSDGRLDLRGMGF